MKKSSMALFAFLLSVSAFAQLENDTLYWSPCYKLRWADFKGNPDTSLQYEALTFSGIEVKYMFANSSFSYNVAAFFIRNKSWKMRSANDVALKHEQEHFDISEIFSRALGKELSKLKPDRLTVKSEVAKCVQKAIVEKENMQNLYDEETNFGRLPTAQQKWEQKIHTLLAKK